MVGVAREQRLVFGEDAELYDRIRPSYPDDLVDDVVGLVVPPCRALDIGCGTGRAAVLLAARRTVGIGLEADPAMADVAKRNLAAFPDWAVVVSDFEGWEPGPGAYDLLTCAQAWHWLDPAVRLGKAHGLLRPGGWLALWWNRPSHDVSAVRHAIDAAYAELAPDMEVHGIGGIGRPRVDPLPAGLAFGVPVEREYRWSHRYTATEWADLMRTQSNHRLLPPAQLDSLLARLTSVIGDNGGVYDHPYTCWLWAVERH
jgi:SAM-dependent methyltransferase